MTGKPVLQRGLYLVTEHRQLAFDDLLSRTEAALCRGVSALQYRNKQAGERERLKEAAELLALCRRYDTPFIVNDDVELAIAVEADGVHVGRHDGTCRAARERLGQDRVVGVSCYNDLERAERAVAAGADYIAFGAMYPTASKNGATPADLETIRIARGRFDIGIAAIGGITPGNCGPVLDAGADLLAVIGSVYLADDPARVVDAYNERLLRHYPNAL